VIYKRGRYGNVKQARTLAKKREKSNNFPSDGKAVGFI
jgi:hypothetical protein